MLADMLTIKEKLGRLKGVKFVYMGDAASDACKIEHVISSESFAAIKKHIDLDSMK